MTREEDIAYDILDGDRIWPPVSSPDRTRFAQALVEVLMRLTDEGYDVVSDRVFFVVEDDRFIATNVPFVRVYPPTTKGFTARFDTIVVFHAALAYPHAALVGLLAHEIAHGFVQETDHSADEEACDDQARQWGFERELEALQAEREAADGLPTEPL